MKHVQEQLHAASPHVSERRVCRVLDQPRSTQRYAAVPRDGDEHLVRRMHELVRLHPRRGYRMMCGMLRLDGWRVNVKPSVCIGSGSKKASECPENSTNEGVWGIRATASCVAAQSV